MNRLRRAGVLAAALALALSGFPAYVASAAAPTTIPPAGFATGIDGFTPIMFNETGPQAGLKAWVIAHHGYAPMTAPKDLVYGRGHSHPMSRQERQQDVAHAVEHASPPAQYE